MEVTSSDSPVVRVDTAPNPHEMDRMKNFSFPVALLCIYVFVEYARPDFLMRFNPGVILLLALSLFLLKNISSVKRVVKDRFYVLFAILLLEMIAHGPIAVNNYWAYQSFLSMFSLFLYSLSIGAFIDTAGKMRIFLTSLIIVHLLAASRYLPVDLNMGYSGIIGETNDFAMAMTVVIPISFFMGISSRGIKRLAFFAATAVFVYANVSTVSRGGFLGMGFMAILGVWFSKSRGKALLILAIAALAFFALAPSNYKKEINSIRLELKNSISWIHSKEVAVENDPDNPKSGTGIDRVELWKVGLRVFVDNPLIGVGQGNLPWVVQGYQNFDEDIWSRGIGGRAIHSAYVSLLAELGLVGMVLFLFIIKDLISKYRRLTDMQLVSTDERSGEKEKLRFAKCCMKGFALSVSGYLVAAIFLSVFGYPQFWHLGGMMVSTCLIATRITLASEKSISEASCT